MELKELTEKMLDLLGISEVKDMPERIFWVVRMNDTSVYTAFSQMVPDLNIDWLQQIYQYYMADRKEKMQDYTPKNLAQFMSKLAGDGDVITDLCAGSGALTIQCWSRNNDQKFELYEVDENVIPILLFNMAVRNIECIVCHADVLQQEIYHTYQIKKGEKFGIFWEVENEKNDNL